MSRGAIARRRCRLRVLVFKYGYENNVDVVSVINVLTAGHAGLAYALARESPLLFYNGDLFLCEIFFKQF